MGEFITQFKSLGNGSSVFCIIPCIDCVAQYLEYDKSVASNDDGSADFGGYIFMVDENRQVWTLDSRYCLLDYNDFSF